MMATKHIISHDAGLLKNAGWESYVRQHSDGNFFQLPQAFDLFGKVPGYQPVVTGVLEDGKIKGVLLCVIQKEAAVYGFLTSRAIIWGGPIVDSPEVAETLVKAFDEFIKGKVIYAQFRNSFNCDQLRTAFSKQRFEYLQHLNYLVSTKDKSTTELLSLMSKSKARQIKKGLQQAEIITATSQQEVDEFYTLLRKMYREKVHKPLPPKSFFDAFFTDIVPTGLGHYLLIRCEGKIIGGIMSPMLPGKAICEWYIAGLDKEYKEQYPSILATWAAIAYGSEHGFECFDFLGAGKPDQDYGVREFKSKFGGELVQFGRFEKVYSPMLMKIGETGLKILKLLKK